MPTLPIRQRLLRGAFKYARKLQDLRRRATEESDSSRSSDVVQRSQLSLSSDSDSLGSDSLASSLSSLSSFNSLGNTAAGYETYSDTDDLSTDAEEDALFIRRLAALQERIDYLTRTRVLFPNRVHKLSQLHLVLVLYKEDDHKRFRQNLRVNPETFDALITRIKDDPIFVSDGPQDQMPLNEQLAITLFRFGHHGNAASVESIAQWAGISAGTVINATRRVMTAFLALHDAVIRWPSAREKEDAKEWVEAATCVAWRNGCVFVDGTLVPLADKPGYHGEAYFDRKSNYSLNVQLITLPNLRIIDYVIGHCGSTHDSTAFRDSHTVIRRQHLIGPGEWIWADSAYPIEAWCITPFKKPAANVPENKVFNYWVSHVRIRSEHAVGFIKGRFQSLKGLRQQIKNAQDHERALAWIRTCIVIHTMVHEIETEEFDEEWIEELILDGLSSDELSSSDEDRVAAQIRRESQGQRKRRKIKQDLFASGIVDHRDSE